MKLFNHANGRLTSTEHADIWTELREFIENRWNYGHGKSTTLSRKYAVYSLFPVLKCTDQRDFLALMFKDGSGTFERIVVNKLNIVSDYAYDRYGPKALHKYDIQTLQDDEACSAIFPMLDIQQS